MREGGDEDGDTDGRVLSSDELDITEREEVASLGEGRFVVGAEGKPDTPEEAIEDVLSSVDRPESAEQQATNEDENSNKNSDGNRDENSDSDEREDTGNTGHSGDTTDDVSGRDVKSWLTDELTRHDSAYVHHIAAKADGDVVNQQLATDDIGAAFDGLLVWYARQVATDTPVDEALGILLAESGVRVRYPPSRLVEYLEANDLGPEDSIADLVSAVSEDDGLVFTKRQ